MKLLLLVLALGFLIPACGHQAPTSAALVERSAALAFNGAATALEILDLLQTQQLEGWAHPTKAQNDAAATRIERLKRARDALVIVRAWLSGERSQADADRALRDAVEALDLVAEELKADGVSLPPAVTAGLSVAATWLKGTP
jgi:hypothetical protein